MLRDEKLPGDFHTQLGREGWGSGKDHRTARTWVNQKG